MYDLSIPGFMHERELKIIEKWASKVPSNGVILELGSMMGRSSYCWAKSCDPSVKVYCVDLFRENFKFNKDGEETRNVNLWEEFNKNTKDIQNIIPIKGYSPRDIMYPGDKIDVFFMDANHSNPSDMENFLYYRKFFNKNVLICGHDYNTQSPDVIENAKYFSEFYNKELMLYEGTSLWSIQT
jgi:hypothetical protein